MSGLTVSGLNLTQIEQDWLAQLASKAASIKYAWLAQDKEPDYAALGEWFAIHCIENSIESTKFGELYDKLHRTGKNF